MSDHELRISESRDWLRYAKSDLALAASKPDGVLLDTLCFHAQQAAEKSLKAVLILRVGVVPYTHDIGELIEALADIEIIVISDVSREQPSSLPTRSRCGTPVTNRCRNKIFERPWN